MFLSLEILSVLCTVIMLCWSVLALGQANTKTHQLFWPTLFLYIACVVFDLISTYLFIVPIDARVLINSIAQGIIIATFAYVVLCAAAKKLPHEHDHSEPK